MKTVIATINFGIDTGEYIMRLPNTPASTQCGELMTEIIKHSHNGFILAEYPMKIITRPTELHPRLEPLNAFSEKEIAMKALTFMAIAEPQKDIVTMYDNLIRTVETLKQNPDMIRQLAKAIAADKAEETILMAEATGQKKDEGGSGGTLH